MTKRSLTLFAFISALMITPANAQVAGDLNSDGDVDRIDQSIFRSSLGECAGNEGFIPETDYNASGCTDLDDYRLWFGFYRDFNPPQPCNDCTGGSRSLLRPGALDIRFGTGGKVVTDVSGAGDSVKDVIIQPDGKIVAAGSSYTGAVTRTDFALVRYNADGTLDTTFGNGGKVMTDFGGYDEFWAAAIQSDGKIVVAGIAISVAGGALVRYNPDGTLDTTFGVNGKVISDLGGGSINDMTILADGKIMVVGLVSVSFSQATLLARYNTDGSLDATFGTDGVIVDSTPPTMDAHRQLSVLSDGKIVVFGNTANTHDFALVRYNADGTLDTTFGSGGKVATEFGGSENAEDLAIAADGKIVLSGYALIASPVPRSIPHYYFALARYNTDGTLDVTFGSDGTVTNDFGGLGTSLSSAIAIQSDGKILAAGLVGDDFALARYNADGTLDTTFGSGGLVTTDFDNNDDSAQALGIQSDGKIILGGTSNADFALARYRY